MLSHFFREFEMRTAVEGVRERERKREEYEAAGRWRHCYLLWASIQILLFSGIWSLSLSLSSFSLSLSLSLLVLSLSHCRLCWSKESSMDGHHLHVSSLKREHTLISVTPHQSESWKKKWENCRGKREVEMWPEHRVKRNRFSWIGVTLPPHRLFSVPFSFLGYFWIGKGENEMERKESESERVKGVCVMKKVFLSLAERWIMGLSDAGRRSRMCVDRGYRLWDTSSCHSALTVLWILMPIPTEDGGNSRKEEREREKERVKERKKWERNVGWREREREFTCFLEGFFNGFLVGISFVGFGGPSLIVSSIHLSNLFLVLSLSLPRSPSLPLSLSLLSLSLPLSLSLSPP